MKEYLAIAVRNCEADAREHEAQLRRENAKAYHEHALEIERQGLPTLGLLMLIAVWIAVLALFVV